MNQDHFAHKSKSWDMSSRRVKNAQSIARLIRQHVALNPKMRVMDFGAGTGLLSYFIAPEVASIVAVDNSPSMLEVFREKSGEFACETEIFSGDIAQLESASFDGIISSMTLHHIEEIKPLFEEFYRLLRQGGFIALADLASEDGSFHSDPKGVYHFGFDCQALARVADEVGFEHAQCAKASTIHKPHRDFEVFLLTAIK